MKNVCIIIDSLSGGGAEKVALTLAKGMHDQQVNVTILSLKRISSYDVPSFVNLVFLVEEGNNTLRGWRNKKSLSSALANKLEEIQQDVGTFDLILVNLHESYRLSSNLNLPNTYYVIHNSYVQELKRELKLGPFKYLYLKSILKSLNGKRLIAVSKGVANELASSKLFQAKSITHINNPFDIEAIQSLANQELPADMPGKYILHVGRAAKAKRHDILFKALKSVEGDYKLVCLSSNPKKLSKLAKKLDVEQDVVLFDFKSNPYVWMKHASAVVLSSDFEGLPMVLIEALICNTPIVSTNCTFGPSEILQGGLKRFLVPVQDFHALASAINKAVSYQLESGDKAILDNVAIESITKQYLSMADMKQ